MVALLAAVVACGAGSSPGLSATAAATRNGTSDRKTLDLALCDPSRSDFSTTSTNPYFPIAGGLQWLYEGEESGEEVRLCITVLAGTEEVAGVTTRILEEREWHDGELVEVSRNFFAATSDETVCYFGEAVDVYEGGAIVSHEGAWRADDPGTAPGIIMPAEPRPGVRFQMELAPGIAEDEGKVVGIGPVTVPAGRFEDAIRVREVNPLDGEKDYKLYAAGVGLVVDGSVELVARRCPSG